MGYNAGMIPATLRAGSAIEWSEGYNPEGGSLVYTIFGQNGVITLTASDRLFSVTSAASAGWAPGRYDWVLRRVVGEEKQDLLRGALTILGNPDIHPEGLDARSHARRVLDAIESVLEGRAGDDVQEISIRGRTVKSMPIADLLRFRSLYRAEVRAEEDALRASQGLASRRILKTRFTHA